MTPPVCRHARSVSAAAGPARRQRVARCGGPGGAGLNRGACVAPKEERERARRGGEGASAWSGRARAGARGRGGSRAKASHTAAPAPQTRAAATTHRLWRLLDLHEAHAAIPRDREALVEAEARHVGARGLDRLQDRRAALDLDRLPVHLHLDVAATLLWHGRLALAAVDWQRLREHSEAILADGLDDALPWHGEGAHAPHVLPRCTPRRIPDHSAQIAPPHSACEGQPWKHELWTSCDGRPPPRPQRRYRGM